LKEEQTKERERIREIKMKRLPWGGGREPLSSTETTEGGRSGGKKGLTRAQPKGRKEHQD